MNCGDIITDSDDDDSGTYMYENNYKAKCVSCTHMKPLQTSWPARVGLSGFCQHIYLAYSARHGIGHNYSIIGPFSAEKTSSFQLKHYCWPKNRALNLLARNCFVSFQKCCWAGRTPFRKQPKKAAPVVPSWLLLPSVVGLSHWLSTTHKCLQCSHHEDYVESCIMLQYNNH